MLKWRNLAECARRDLHTSLFFPEREGLVDFRVIDACRSCQVIRQCRQFALDMEAATIGDTRSGIWGGMTPRQRTNYVRYRSYTTIFTRDSTAYRVAIRTRQSARSKKG